MVEYVAIILFDDIDLHCLIAPTSHIVAGVQYQRQPPEKSQLSCYVLVFTSR